MRLVNKHEFLVRLRAGLSGMPPKDTEGYLTFYTEMIDDRMEEGIPEEEAVAQVGGVDELVLRILQEAPLTKTEKEKNVRKKEWKIWEIVLLVLGSPIWLSLGIAVLAVLLAVYASVWAVIISLWAVFIACVSCVFAGLLGGIGVVIDACGYRLTGVAMIAGGIFCAGLSIFMFFGCKALTEGVLLCTRKLWLLTKKLFVKGGAHNA